MYNYYYKPESAIVTKPEDAIANSLITGTITFGGPLGAGVGFGSMFVRWLFPDGFDEPVQRNWENTCFVAGTKNLMANGEEKNIEEVKAGDTILSVNMESMEVEIDNVIIVPDKEEYYDVINVYLDNGQIIMPSPHHPFFVKNKGWSVYDVEMA